MDGQTPPDGCFRAAWKRTRTLPSSPSLIDRLGSRSSWAGQCAIQPPPALRPPRALAMVSAVMAHLLVIGGEGLAGVVRRRGHLGPRPLGEDGEEAGDVLGDLPGVVIGEVAGSVDGERPAAVRAFRA